MPNKPLRVYWDSCVYIDCIQQNPDRHVLLDSIVKQARNGEIVLVASALVLAEVAKLKDPDATREQETKRICRFFENDFIKFRDVTRRIAEQAADMTRLHSIKPSDAIHVATALACECISFQTYDGEQGRGGKLIALNGKIGHPPLRIEVPRVVSKDDPPGQGRLPFG